MLDLGEVSHEAAEHRLRVDGHLHRGQFDDALGAVGAQHWYPHLAGELTRIAGGEVGPDVLGEPGSVPVRNQEPGHLPAEHVLTAVAREFFRRGIEFHQSAAGVHGQDRVRGPRDQRPGQRLPFAERGHVVGVPDLRRHHGRDGVRGGADIFVPVRRVTDQGQRAQAPTADRHRVRQQRAGGHALRFHRHLNEGRGGRVPLLQRRRADLGQQHGIDGAARVHGQHGGRLAGRWLKGQRGVQAGDGHEPGQHGGKRAEGRVVAQDLPHREIEHGRR